MFYRFHPSNNFVRGTAFARTPQLVFEPATTLPVVTINGPGVPYTHNMKALQPPQIHVADTWLLAGLGGVTAGGIYGYPLSANSLGVPLNPSPQ